MAEAGLAVREDAMGNIFGRLEGSDPDAGRFSGVFASNPRSVLPCCDIGGGEAWRFLLLSQSLHSRDPKLCFQCLSYFTQNSLLYESFFMHWLSKSLLSFQEAVACSGAVVSGSHTDAIPLAGMYDGTLGVIGAIAALKALREAGFKAKRPIDAMMFTSEEPTRFGLGCIGRQALSIP